MRIKPILSILVLTLFMVGCAHTQSPSAVNRLQIKVAQLERKLADRDQEVGDLQTQVQNLNSQISEIETYSLNEPIEEYDYRKISREIYVEEDGRDEIVQTSKKDDRVIRVAASARDIQQALKNAGYYTGKVDGKFGKQSQKALSAFQTDHNLVRDGIVGKRTWSELRSYLK